MTWRDRLELLDRGIAHFMARWGTRALRVALAVIFVWFGVLKPLGLSPAEPLVLATVDWLPVLSPRGCGWASGVVSGLAAASYAARGCGRAACDAAADSWGADAGGVVGADRGKGWV